jgi:non-lysosomal glucosylceramidase
LKWGTRPYAKDLREIYRKGERLSAKRLWNGEYFIQEVDLKDHPKDQYGEGCLSDQLLGQNWAHLTGLGHVYPRDKVRKALESVWKYNWTTDVGAYNKVHPTKRAYALGAEAGLITCTWPRSEYLTEGVAYKEEVWTGIEYEVASTMIREGMVEEGLSICRAVHERYHPEKRNPYNEVECGDFYARSMASWGVLLALSGYTHHGPKGHLGFGPRVTPEDFRCAFTTAEGWGSFSQRFDGAAARVGNPPGERRPSPGQPGVRSPAASREGAASDPTDQRKAHRRGGKQGEIERSDRVPATGRGQGG